MNICRENSTPAPFSATLIEEYEHRPPGRAAEREAHPGGEFDYGDDLFAG